MSRLTEQDKQYLEALRASEFQAIDEFDKTILALTGGAFGVSFAFLKDIVAPGLIVNKGWLMTAWIAWCCALMANLTSFYFSHLAMRRAQREYRRGERDEAKLSGFFGTSVMWLNPSAGGLFIAGLICMSIFVTSNLRDSRANPPTSAAPAAATNAAPAAATSAAPAAATSAAPAAHTGTP